MDTAEAGRRGGLNSRKNLPPERIHELAMKAAKASAKKRKANKKAKAV